MIYLIVGHRGVGKTLWLKKLEKLFASFQKTGVQTPLFFDLDKIVEKATQRSIHSYFQDQESQKVFRCLEHTVLMGLINKYKFKKRVVFIALGAGFEWKTFGLFPFVSGLESQLIEPSGTLSPALRDRHSVKTDETTGSRLGAELQPIEPSGTLSPALRDRHSVKTDETTGSRLGAESQLIEPSGTLSPALRVVHLVRETDSHGRVFLDRPRLCKNKSPYEEYMFFYPQRERVYQQVRTESFVLPEQDFECSKAEELFFAQELFPDSQTLNDHNSNLKILQGAIITLNKKSLPVRIDQWPAFIQKRLSWGLSFFELRDDQLSSKELEYLLSIIPKHKQLLSFYSKKNYFFKKIIEAKKECDGVVQDSRVLRKVSGGTKEAPSVEPVIWVDWPLEKGQPAFSPSNKMGIIASLHERKGGESIRGLGQKLIQHKADHFKLAVLVKSFSELLEGHLWFLQDPQNRSFLPISAQNSIESQKGREPLFLPQNRKWAWYRQVFGPYMKMNFIREGPSFVPDQPFLNQTARKPVSFVQAATLENSRSIHKALQHKGFKQAKPTGFVKGAALGAISTLRVVDKKQEKPKTSISSLRALKKSVGPLFCAVFGDPVVHSASPAFHRAFFEKQGMVFVKIQMTEEEMTEENMGILQKMGLRFSAVTSPLKQKAFAVCDVADSPARSLKAVNTMIWKDERWFGYNTDLHGFLRGVALGVHQGLVQDSTRQKKVAPFVPPDTAVGSADSLVQGLAQDFTRQKKAAPFVFPRHGATRRRRCGGGVEFGLCCKKLCQMRFFIPLAPEPQRVL